MTALRATTRQIVVDRNAQHLTLWHRNFAAQSYHKVKQYTVSTGVVGLATPAGRYEINDKSRHPSYTYPDSDWVPPELRGKTYPFGDPNNPIVGRWMGLANGVDIEYVGIHGSLDVADLGTRASHGCVRMSAADVTDLFDRVVIHTTVFII